MSETREACPRGCLDAGVHRTCVHATTEVCARSMADVVRWSYNPCSCCRTCSGSVRPILWTRLEQMTAVQLFPNPCTPHPSNLPAPNEPFTSAQVQGLLVLPFFFHHLLPDKEKLAERHVVFLTAIYIGKSRRSSCVSGVAGALAGASGTHYDEMRSLVAVALLRHVFMKLLLGELVQRHGASILAAFKRILQQQLVHGSLTLRLPEQRSQGDTTWRLTAAVKTPSEPQEQPGGGVCEFHSGSRVHSFQPRDTRSFGLHQPAAPWRFLQLLLTLASQQVRAKQASRKHRCTSCAAGGSGR